MLFGEDRLTETTNYRKRSRHLQIDTIEKARSGNKERLIKTENLLESDDIKEC